MGVLGYVGIGVIVLGLREGFLGYGSNISVGLIYVFERVDGAGVRWVCWGRVIFGVGRVRCFRVRGNLG